MFDVIRGSFPTHGEDVDVASVACCHFRQVCVGAEEQGHSVGNVSSSHTCDMWLLASWAIV